MNCLVINNPNSGKCKSANDLDYIKSRLLEKYEIVDIINTKERGEATIISENNCGNYHTYVVVGGDGTYSEVLQGIVGRENRPKVGYIPTGTVNDFAKSCKIPINVSGALDIIIYGKAITRSTMFVNGKVAVYVVAAGMLTSSSYTTSQKIKKTFGKIGYYIQALFKDKYRNGTFLRVFAEKAHRAKFTTLVCLHGVSMGGFRFFNKFSQNASDFYTIMLKRARGLYGYFLTLCHILKILVKKLDNIKPNKYIVIEKVSSLIIKAKSKDMVWNVDGEQGPTGDVEISIKPNQYEAIVGF